MSTTIHLLPTWSDEIVTEVSPQPLCGAAKAPDQDLWNVLLSLRTTKGDRHLLALTVDPRRDRERKGVWGIRRLGPGVWTLESSVPLGDSFAFITLCGVPEPAPWLWGKAKALLVRPGGASVAALRLSDELCPHGFPEKNCATCIGGNP